MIDKHDTLYKDFEAVKQITIVPTMLDVVCRITGMGFAAVARVTENRWLACSVKDDVNFGLAAGGELEVKTTICDEIRDSHQEVVIDNVSLDDHFKSHHTPKMYGLQSYISYPIILKNGDFFGTLCAIDSQPHIVDKPEIRGTFKLFAELLAFHLQSLDLLDRSQSELKESSKTLGHLNTENEIYRKISNHNIQELVRKVSLFSNMLAEDTQGGDFEKIKQTSAKINAASTELSHMIQQVTQFSAVDSAYPSSEVINLNEIIEDILAEVGENFKTKNISTTIGELPCIAGSRPHMRETFYQLLNHAITFTDGGNAIEINIYSNDLSTGNEGLPKEQNESDFTEIVIEQRGTGIDKYHLNNIFDLFIHTDKSQGMKYGTGLAYSRKVIQTYGGLITANQLTDKDNGISFTILLPRVEVASI